MLRPTVSRPVCLGIKHPFGAYDHMFVIVKTAADLLKWAALTDEGRGYRLPITVRSNKPVVSMYNLQLTFYEIYIQYI
jgi:hypothetical protein